MTLHTEVLQGHFTQLTWESCRGAELRLHSRQAQPYDDWYSNVFKRRRKIRRDGASLTLAGRLFHACDAATENKRSPSDDQRADRTSNVGVVAEHRQQRPSMSVVGWSISAGYGSTVKERPQNIYFLHASSSCLLLSPVDVRRSVVVTQCYISNSMQNKSAGTVNSSLAAIIKAYWLVLIKCDTIIVSLVQWYSNDWTHCEAIRS